MLRVPVGRVVVVSCTLQWKPLAVQGTALPRLVRPSLNWTVPSGVRPEPSVGLTTAMKLIASPWSEGLSVENSAVVVA